MVDGPDQGAASRWRARAAAIVAIALAAASAASTPVAAASTPAARATVALTTSDGGAPPFVRAARGAVVRRAVRVTNLTNRRVTVVLQAADLRNATNGNADYRTTHVTRDGRWVHLARSRVRLRPLASRRVSFRVSVPRSARGSSHYAGIVATNAAELAAAARASKRSRGKAFRFARVNRQALPITVRLPGRVTRHLSLRSIRIDASSAGAGLVLALRPDGSTVIRDAPISLRVSHGGRRVFAHVATLGQLFPGSSLRYRIPWRGRPTEGSYRVVGVLRPRNAPPVRFDRTVGFAAPAAAKLQREMPPAAQRAGAALPGWVWLALGAATLLLLALSVAVWKLAHRPPAPSGGRDA